MKAFRDYILTEIQTRLPQLKTVRMFNNQFENSNNDDSSLNIEAAFPYPACFVEVIPQETRSVALGIKYVDLIVRLHLGLENYRKQRPNDYITIDDVSEAMQGMRGDTADTVQFSSMEEQQVTIDTDFNNVNRPVLEFNTTYTKLNTYTRKNFILKSAPTLLQTDAEIVETVTGTPINPCPQVPPSNWAELVALVGQGYAYPQPTGQTTVYRTGDDADIEATVFAPIRAANSLKAINTLANFTTLNNNNSFGNTNRFTDIDGLQVYGDDYLIDHYTGLGWSRLILAVGNWNDSIELSQSITRNTYSDWFMPNNSQILSIADIELTSVLNYSPININAGFIFISTTSKQATGNAFVLRRDNHAAGLLYTVAKGVSATQYICRKHF